MYHDDSLRGVSGMVGIDKCSVLIACLKGNCQLARNLYSLSSLAIPNVAGGMEEGQPQFLVWCVTLFCDFSEGGREGNAV